jgi:hypothetical protein
VRSCALWFVLHLRFSGPAGPRGQDPLARSAHERFAPPAIFFDPDFVAADYDSDFVLPFFNSGAEAASVLLPCIFVRVFLSVGLPSHAPASVRQLLFPVHRLTFHPFVRFGSEARCLPSSGGFAVWIWYCLLGVFGPQEIFQFPLRRVQFSVAGLASGLHLVSTTCFEFSCHSELIFRFDCAASISSGLKNSCRWKLVSLLSHRIKNVEFS